MSSDKGSSAEVDCGVKMIMNLGMVEVSTLKKETIKAKKNA